MFFTAIHQMMTESVDLTIVIRKTNGQLTVSTLPKSNGLKDEAQNHIVPLTVTGTGHRRWRVAMWCIAPYRATICPLSLKKWYQP